MTLSSRTRYLFSLLSGLLLAVSYPPFGLWGGLAAFIGIIPLLIALENTTRLRDAFNVGYVALFVWSFITTYWIGGWQAEGNVDTFLMVSGIALALIHPLMLSVPVLLYDVARRRYGRFAALLILPVFWVGYEYMHSLGDLSFPWLNLFNTQTYNLSYIQFIEFTGSYGLSLAIILVNILLYMLLRQDLVLGAYITKAANALGFKKKIRIYGITAVASLIIVPYIYGSLRMTDLNFRKGGKQLTVSIIQPNFNPWDKWNRNSRAVTDSMLRSSVIGVRVDLLLWPETAITYPITLPRNIYDLKDLYSFIDTIGVPILTGIPDREEYIVGKDSIPPDAKPSRNEKLMYRDWNSALLFYKEPSGNFTYQRYHKQKLVPFGERVPFVDAIPLLGDVFKWGVGLGSWNVGDDHTVFALPYKGNRPTGSDTARLCTMICYESVYPDYVREFTKRGAELITVITNDGWYGKSFGPHQHNQYAVLRAIENRRWLARSANTGISSVINDKGEIVVKTNLMESASITMQIPLKSEITFYTRIGDVIAIPFYWATLGSIAFFVITGFRRKRNNAPTT
jgi:apolipoprotein N-acyltransferase